MDKGLGRSQQHDRAPRTIASIPQALKPPRYEAQVKTEEHTRFADRRPIPMAIGMPPATNEAQASGRPPTEHLPLAPAPQSVRDALSSMIVRSRKQD
jgi:hypothetical protein